MGIGLILDIGSASFIGVAGFTRGLAGLSASLLGRKVLDISSPSSGIFLAAFSLVEDICIALFLQLCYGEIPFFSLLASRIIPRAIYTGALGVALLHLLAGRNVLAALKRRDVQKEL